ncbi:hypothetical protein KAI65_03555 [Candidatus Parcubacteria bacterium]|nr:hypothetical protein [Candidatus Parcubacteria bacterium]
MEVGLVVESIKGGVKIFITQAPEKIQFLIQEKEREIVLAKHELAGL